MKNTILILCSGIEYKGDGEIRWYTPRLFIDYILPIVPDEINDIEELIKINRQTLLEKVIKECRTYRPCKEFELISSKWVIRTDINDELTTENRVYQENGN